jgi:predicted transcriptional regulator of viral defense system
MNLQSSQSALKSKLAQLLGSSNEIITVDLAVQAWNISREQARWFLYSFCKQGWLSRIKQGYYVPVDLASNLKAPPLEHPWAVAAELWEPCCIGGWTACEYWDFTEQIFNTVFILTTKQQPKKEYELNGTKYLLNTIQESMMFGTKTVWQGQSKVQISDPSKTMIDMFYKPAYGAGIRQVIEFYKSYLNSKHKNIDLLVEYALKFNKGVVFKRLGFITENFFPQEKAIIEVALKNLSAGYSSLDIDLAKDRLVSKWRLWISNSWAKDISL